MGMGIRHGCDVDRLPHQWRHDDATPEAVSRRAYESRRGLVRSRRNLLQHAQSLKSLTSAAAASASLRPDGILCFASYPVGL